MTRVPSSVRAFLAISTLLLIGVAVAGAWAWAGAWTPSRHLHRLQGVDLGTTPGEVDWPAVRAAGAGFAYLTATVGADAPVAGFEAAWQAVDAAGLRRGAVHVYSLCAPAGAQADLFNTVVPRDPGALPAAVDVSFDDGCTRRPERAELIGDLARFLTIAEGHTGSPMLLRVDRKVERAYSLTLAIPRPIWVTGNFIAPDYGARPWRLWRASDWRRLDGINRPVNWNVVAP